MIPIGTFSIHVAHRPGLSSVDITLAIKYPVEELPEDAVKAMFYGTVMVLRSVVDMVAASSRGEPELRLYEDRYMVVLRIRGTAPGVASVLLSNLAISLLDTHLSLYKKAYRGTLVDVINELHGKGGSSSLSTPFYTN